MDFKLERAIGEWRRGFRKFESFEDGALAEIESHLRDEFERRIRSGAGADEAFSAAVARVGKPEDVGAEYFRDGARSPRARAPWTAPWFSPVLIGSHLKVALRKILRRKGTDLVNVLGLAVGMAACLLILFWVRDELGFDRFHPGVERIHRLLIAERSGDNVSYYRELPYPVTDVLAKTYPEIEATARTYAGRFQVRHGDKAFMENGFVFVDPSFFEIFSFKAAAGNPAAALADRSSAVLARDMASKYFGDDDPLGKTLNLDGRNDYTVGAVVEIPRNSDFNGTGFFLPLRSLDAWGLSQASLESNWRGRMYRSYIKLRPGTDPRALEEKAAGLLKEHNPGRGERLRLQPLVRIHLYAPDGSQAGMRIVVVLSLIAALILIIACINFMNLATARAGTRAREIGLRKTVGASRSQLIRQILSESLLLAFLAMALSLALISLALLSFNGLTRKSLALDFGDPAVVLGLVGIALLAGTMAGVYPAFILSSFPPATVLRNRSSSPGGSARFRKALLLFQFSVSIILIVATAVILSQIQYIRNREIGFDRENLVTAYMTGQNRDNAEALKRELEKHPGFLGASACNNLPTQIIYQFSADWEGRDRTGEVEFSYTSCDFDYVKTFRMTIVEGRDFSRDRPADEEAFLINQEAARRIGLKSPIGLKLKFMDGHWGEIIGIVKDFNFRDMGTPINPLVLTPKGRKNYFVARLRPGDPGPALRYLEEAWNRVNPGFVFQYGFVDQAFDRLYTNERQLGRIVGSFSLLAMFISCLGLIGLAAFTAEQKTKEIGIRKTLGASIADIVFLLSGGFSKTVLAANLVSWPVAWFAMNNWLRGYAYRTSLNPWIFIGAGLVALAVAWLAVAFQTLRSALTNPVEALRFE